MQNKVIDLITKASKGERLPDYVKVQGDSHIWVKTGGDGSYNYISGKQSLGDIAAFDTDLLNRELEEVTVITGE